MFPMHATLLCALVAPFVPPEVAWARGIMDELWATTILASDRQHQDYLGLMTPELARNFQVSRGELNDFDSRIDQHYRNGLVTVSSTTLSPDRAEVVIKGRLVGKELAVPGGKKVEADFTIRVARQPVGAWSIRLLRVGERVEKVGPEAVPEKSVKP